jgi:hypothetical protein
MRTALEISNDINFHLSKLRELSAEVASVNTTSNNISQCQSKKRTKSEKKPRRKKSEWRTLIEAAIDTYGADTPDNFIAKNIGLNIAAIYKKPYSIYLDNARNEYRKKQNAEKAAEYKTMKYKDD